MTKPPFVIINDIDAPEPRNVCQWVEGVGYCYQNRRGTRPAHDGMTGSEATPIQAFGFAWVDDPDGTVSFRLSGEPVMAVYRDGEPRRWQHPAETFSFCRLTPQNKGWRAVAIKKGTKT